MKKILELISDELKIAFEEAGYDGALGKATISNRPDLCEYQCNGAMAGAKQYKKAPIMIANEVAEKLQGSNVFAEVSAVAPGFLNLKIKEELKRRNISRELSEEILAEFTSYEDEICALISKKLRGKEFDSDMKRKLISYLGGRGYRYDEIRSAFNKMQFNTEDMD